MSTSHVGFTRESQVNQNFLMLITECSVSDAYNVLTTSMPKTNVYNGLWDTGATNTVITEKVAKDLNLSPRGKVTSYTAAGPKDVETYYINIGLPNGVGFQYVKVTEGDLNGFDVLIGMDIIAAGEFSLRHENGKHVFEFKLPAPTITPPTAPIPVNQNAIQHVSRNEPCPCGSGNKFKNCHGSGSYTTATEPVQIEDKPTLGKLLGAITKVPKPEK